MLWDYVTLVRGLPCCCFMLFFKLVRHWVLWKSDSANFLEWLGVWVGAEPYLSHGLLIWISLRVVLHINFNEWHMGRLMRFLNVLLLI